MAAIKASTLTGGSLISATKASPPPAPTLVEGVPISGGAPRAPPPPPPPPRHL